ncbi:hypothetical protein CSHISOI_07196 [Colletotrichum shisoi]|uniref:Uncharacterized protein n=1 Tax=Colletotrichum shisoi TaxID=2078593 RepID=A0A5Q4BNE9_9PEZI|nr:hypothetical protein CSHISOI_07196 [Colletotrichum shisoi]
MPRGRRQTELKDSLKFQTGNSVEDPEASGRERERRQQPQNIRHRTSDIGDRTAATWEFTDHRYLLWLVGSLSVEANIDWIASHQGRFVTAPKYVPLLSFRCCLLPLASSCPATYPCPPPVQCLRVSSLFPALALPLRQGPRPPSQGRKGPASQPA